MAIDFTLSTDVQNPSGKVRLVTSLELYAQVPDANGTYYSTPIGMAQKMNIQENRHIDYNFVIGNKNPSRCRDLIPGPVIQSTIEMSMVSLYVTNGIGLFTTPNPQSTAVAPALPYNTRPFNIVERWLNPSTGNTLYEMIYTGCYIERYTMPRDMTSGQIIKVVEDMTVHFKDIVYVPSSDFESDVAGGTLGNPFIAQP